MPNLRPLSFDSYRIRELRDDDVAVIPAIQLNTTGTFPHSEGLLHWNDDDKTLNLDTEVVGTRIQVGQEIVFRATNKTGTTLTNGSLVYINGAQGNRPTVAKASASVEIGADNTIGMVTADISNNGTGSVTEFGLVRDLDTSGYTAGDQLWLSETAGEFTATKPVSPLHAIRIGHVVRVNATEGIVLIDVDTGVDLDDVHDVDLVSEADNDFLQYDSGSQTWKNRKFPKQTEQTVTGADTVVSPVVVCTGSGYTLTMPNVATFSGCSVKVYNNHTSGFIRISTIKGVLENIYYGESVDLYSNGTHWLP